ncbi:MAG: LacI family DNA-binding transcriptional regulator [Rhodothermales bacterium]|nr:LacI family DNA-binding transcriptional regulator [Rhodothermales bacterium]
MSKDKITIYDIAERAEVGISTVSRVLNDSPNVTDRTRNRVVKAIRDLEYRPSRTARSLARSANRYLAVAIPSFTTPFHTELLKGVRRCLASEAIDLLLCDLGSINRQSVLKDFLRRGALDGLLLVGVQVDETVQEELNTSRTPVVLIGSEWPGLDSFRWDDVEGARAATAHLLEEGHENVGLIRTHLRDIENDDRFRGYRQALSDAGRPLNLDLVVHGETKKHRGFSEETGYEAMLKLLKVDPTVSAVFACSDVQALGAWRAIVDSGRSVPDNVALVGYDNLKSSHYIGLTTIDQRMGEVAERATKLLLQRIRGEGGDEREAELVTPKLIVRRSSTREVR